jgi:hypothetical protein
MAKPVRSRLDRLVEESRQPQAAPYLSIVHPLAARYWTERSRCRARREEEHDPHNHFD